MSEPSSLWTEMVKQAPFVAVMGICLIYLVMVFLKHMRGIADDQRKQLNDLIEHHKNDMREVNADLATALARNNEVQDAILAELLRRRRS